MADRESTDKIEKNSYYFMLLLLHFCKIKHYPRTEELSIIYMKNKIHFWVFWMQAESLLCSKSRMLTWKLEILRSSIPTQIVWATFNGFEAHLVKIDHFLVYSQSPVLCQFEFFLPFCVYKEGRSQLLNIGQGTRPARTHFIGLSVLERGKMTRDKIEDC